MGPSCTTLQFPNLEIVTNHAFFQIQPPAHVYLRHVVDDPGVSDSVSFELKGGWSLRLGPRHARRTTFSAMR